MEENISWLSPVPQKNISRVVTDKILDAILQDKIKPGEFLPSETQLAATLNVGKSSIREATKMLEAMGIVEIIKGQGCRVRTALDSNALNPLLFFLVLQKNKASHKQFVQFRALFETSVGELAIESMSDKQLAEIIKLHDLMKQNNSKHINNLDYDILFHSKIYDACDNPFISCIGKAIMQLFRPSMSISNRDYGDTVIADHEIIIDALQSRDKKKFREGTNSAIRSWERLTL